MGSFRIQPLRHTIEEELRVWASSLLASALAESMGGKATNKLLVMLRLNSESGQRQIDALADRAHSIADRFDDQELSERISWSAYHAETPTITEKYDDGSVNKYISVKNPLWVIDDFRALVPALALRLLDDAEKQVNSDYNKTNALKLLMFTERVLWKKAQSGANRLTIDPKTLGKKGGEAKNAKMNALKQWTIETWQEGDWKSPKDASRKLVDKVVEQGKQIGVFLAQTNAERTVYDWILKAKNYV